MRNLQLLQCLTIASTFFIPFSSEGQPQKLPAMDVSQNFKTVEDQALNHPIAYPLLKVLSDEIGPRLTGSPSDSRAQQCALQEMRNIGLSYVRGEEWQLKHGVLLANSPTGSGGNRACWDYFRLAVTLELRSPCCFCNLLCASFSAVTSPSAAFTFISGSTPISAQSVFEKGLIAFVSGMPIPK
jgi:hypothetical protein